MLNFPTVHRLPRDSYHHNSIIEKQLPHQNADLFPGIKWGNFCQLYTPAFWKYMYLSSEFPENKIHHRLGSNIIEEIVACLLGGYGMPSELGMAAFERLKKGSLILNNISYKKINTALSEPFILQDGRKKKYRFHNQKSRYVHSFLNRNDLDSIPDGNDIAFRSWLITIDGIGPKTASWITRNWLKSEKVAILDLHILRAGKIAGLFDQTANVSTEYFQLESLYIAFCNALEVLPSNMDAVIWNYMKKTNKLALKVLASTLN